jgi:hypothetical protein
MAYTGFEQTDPLQIARTLDTGVALADLEINKLQPPGNQADATAPLYPHKTGLYEALVHTVSHQLGGTITQGQVWTMTITQVRTAEGVAAASGLVPVVLTVTVDVTATAASLGAQFTAAALAASTIGSLADIDSATRLAEIATVADDGSGLVTATATMAGATFTVAFTTQAGGTAVIDPGSTDVDAARDNLRVGIFVVRDGVSADGRTPIVRPPASGDTADMLYGVVAVGNRMAAIDPNVGYTFMAYYAGRDVPIIPLGGTFTAFSESSTAAFADVWVRMVATGDEVAGAVTDTPGSEVVTVTPTAANDTNYAGFVQVFDGDGTVLATSSFNFTSDGSATDTEIVTGITADLTGSAVDDHVTLGGTTTLTISPDAGKSAVFTSTGVGVLTPATLPTEPTHVKLAARFTQATAATGSCEMDFTL